MQHIEFKYNKKLTEKQAAIVSSEIYPKYLRAGAGTGKTEVLVQKIGNILDIDIDCALSNFAIITFTNKATEEMQNRISDMLYKKWLISTDSKSEKYRKDIETVCMSDICTIHSFCENLLRQYGLHINLASNFKIKSFKKEMTDIISAVVDDNYDNSLLNNIPEYVISKLITILLINNSNRGVKLSQDVLKSLGSPVVNNNYWNAFKVLFLEMYHKAYDKIEQEKKSQNVLTPNDLIRKTSELLTVPYIANRVAGKYKYVFIDEFQDTNKDQFNFVQILIDNGVKVFLVGDDKQSIYAFRGADIQNSQDMHCLIKELSKTNKTEYLDENFRSTKEVIDTINLIFSHKFTYNGEVLSFPVEPLKAPKNIPFNVDTLPLKMTFEKSVTEIIKEIISNTVIDGRKAEYGDIAVLCRRNFDLDKIGAELKNNGLPTFIVGGKGFYKAKEIVDTYKLINAILNTDIRYKNELIFTDYYKAITSNTSGIEFNDYLLEIQAIFRKETVEETLTFIFEKSSIYDFYRQNKNYQAISNLHKLKDIARGLMDKDNIQPLQFLEYLYIMISTNQEEDEADIPEVERKDGVVTLYSIHKAKGLSFPIIIIPCCDNKLNRPITRPKIIFDIKSEIPSIAFDYQAINKELPSDLEYQRLFSVNIKEQLEEEIRIFYVACTRAEKQIILANNSSISRVKQTLRYNDYASISQWIFEIKQPNFF
ncbi:MAG: UvrD-helicase domain-containing protein [Eubacteriales bacterium]|nr:UvrD-helicase domain-containing protein [Eubacteriales bacterium]